ncbi:MAG: DUF1444 family protein [Gemmataceae bacterium]|nr:DUF1444 family protein [Gemmataceae bacterium]
MQPTRWTTFSHPHEVYRLEYPAEWEHLEKEEARSCGFGPKERDDVGLWISIMPFSVDTPRLVDDLPKLMKQSLEKTEAGNLRHDTTLRHYGLKADMLKDDQAGHYWIMAGGDVVLFASTQVPPAERDVWNPLFDRVMASLQITRDDELIMIQSATEALQLLRKKFPDEDFELEEKGIRGKGQRINLNNLYRQVKASPKRKSELVKSFIDGITQSVTADVGTEEWEEVNGVVVPLLKPVDYLVPNTPTEHLHTTEWLADVVICYVIKREKFYRFVTGWDIRRWDITAEQLEKRAIENLARLPWPNRLEGSRQRDGGRVIVIMTKDDLASSRLLHPDLHQLFSGPLGSPFWAGVPDRATLVVYSDRRALKQRIARTLKKDHHRSAYPVTPRPFLVTRDGIAPSE